ncbi:uncharacterized protein loaf [Palaemon carinicauda]|uniref:uncharacterized protein loaf n=1 Tax=Palaemon carinicauda TaxID=392227 RepID=UPI0035B630E8
MISKAVLVRDIHTKLICCEQSGKYNGTTIPPSSNKVKVSIFEFRVSLSNMVPYSIGAPLSMGSYCDVQYFYSVKHTCLHFRCETTNYCVDRELTCDNVNHCGDGSDESASLARCPSTPLVDILGLSGELLATIVASVAFLCCACGVAVVVCIYRRNRQLPPPQGQPSYPMEVSGNYGTNGTFGTMLVEKPPPYPGAPQHTSVLPPGSSPGNLVRPAFGVGCSTLRPLTDLFFPCL